jgi:hypothetical protein
MTVSPTVLGMQLAFWILGLPILPFLGPLTITTIDVGCRFDSPMLTIKPVSFYPD